MVKNNTSPGRDNPREAEDLLTGYIDKTLTAEEMQAFEKELAADPFLADALEGLKDNDPVTVAHSVKLLKKQLHRQVRQKNRDRKRGLVMDHSMYWAIILILVLAVAAFFVLQFLRHR